MLFMEVINFFYEYLYLYQSYCWYAFIRQDFLQYYRYSQKWVNLFKASPHMIAIETGHYIKGMHSLLNAHFDLRNYKAFDETLREFEAFASNIKKGETIGLKEELERLKSSYHWIPSSETDSLLNKFIFWEKDVIAKFGTLGNILFGFDSYALTPIAKSQLDPLIILYKQTPVS